MVGAASAVTTIGTNISTGGYASSTGNINTQSNLHVGGSATIDGSLAVVSATSSSYFVVGAPTPKSIDFNGDLTVQDDVEIGGWASSTDGFYTQGDFHAGGTFELEGDLDATGYVVSNNYVSSTVGVFTQGTLHAGGSGEIEGHLDIGGRTTSTGHIYLPAIKFQTGVATSTNPSTGECFFPIHVMHCYDGSAWQAAW